MSPTTLDDVAALLPNALDITIDELKAQALQGESVSQTLRRLYPDLSATEQQLQRTRLLNPDDPTTAVDETAAAISANQGLLDYFNPVSAGGRLVLDDSGVPLNPEARAIFTMGEEPFNVLSTGLESGAGFNQLADAILANDPAVSNGGVGPLGIPWVLWAIAALGAFVLFSGVL